MIDEFEKGVALARLTLPDLLWVGVELGKGEAKTTIQTVATSEDAARTWAAAAPGRLLFAVAVPKDAVIYEVEPVPATTRLKQVKP